MTPPKANPPVRINGPDLWLQQLPRPHNDGHKYARGAVLVFAGSQPGIGAPRLAARAALRVGAGIVTLAARADTLELHLARGPDALMVRRGESHEDVAGLLADPRLKAALIGPAYGVGPSCVARVTQLLEALPACVLDADALTSFAGQVQNLAALIKARSAPVVLTPHEGEYTRLFGPILQREEAARQAARLSGAIIVLKGHETLIAAPDGRLARNGNAPPDLATAGSGDVLAGLITGLLAQGMAGFEASCAAVWLHGAAGAEAGAGLIADDLPEAIRPELRRLRAISAV